VWDKTFKLSYLTVTVILGLCVVVLVTFDQCNIDMIQVHHCFCNTQPINDITLYYKNEVYMYMLSVINRVKVTYFSNKKFPRTNI